VSLANWCPAFQEDIVVLYSRAEMPKTEDFAALQNETIALPRKVGHRSPSDLTSHP
jgi:hypothetical protein